jgi:molybdopterin/thiamine biosynthesis adenylyltransferase
MAAAMKKEGTMMDLSRQSLIIPAGTLDEMTFLVIGAGGIGSNAINVMARMGVSHITVYDDDEVSEPNIAPGYFIAQDLGGFPKVQIVASSIIDAGFEVEFETHQEKFGGATFGSYNVVLVATDTMQSRRAIWGNPNLHWEHFIDARMGGDQCSVYYVNKETGHGLEEYETAVQYEQQGMECGEKATAFLTAGIIPGFIGTVLFHLANGTVPPQHMWFKAAVPFFTIVR